MTGSIVIKHGKPVLITGSPGGSRIISTVLQVIVNTIDFNRPIDATVSAPRLHHQWLPDVVATEPGFALDTLQALQARGHTISPGPPSTSANSILVTPVNYPRIYDIAEEMKATLHYEKPVYIFVFEHGSFNAFMRKFFFRRAIFLNSEILNAGVSDDEVRWLIGRFIGYWYARRRFGLFGWLIRVAERFVVFNFFILPYERAMVYTGYRLALAIDDTGLRVQCCHRDPTGLCVSSLRARAAHPARPRARRRAHRGSRGSPGRCGSGTCD